MKIRHLHCWNVVKIEEKVVIEFDFKGHNIIGKACNCNFNPAPFFASLINCFPLFNGCQL